MNSKTKKELLQIVKTNYQAIASDFSKTREQPFWPGLQTIIKQYITAEKEDKILDVGCGNGRLVNALPENINYIGLDNSSELIRIASALYQNKLQAKFVVGDILNLNNLPEVNFNFVFAIAVLQHIPSKELRIEALKQLKNKLAKGGKIILTNWNLWADKKRSKLIWRFWLLKLVGKQQMDFGDILFDWHGASKPSRRYYHAFTKCELKRLAKKAGLKIVEQKKDQFNYYTILERKN